MLIKQIRENLRQARIDHINENQRINDMIPNREVPLPELQLAIYVDKDSFHAIHHEAEGAQWSEYTASEFLKDKKICGTPIHEVLDPNHPAIRIVRF